MNHHHNNINKGIQDVKKISLSSAEKKGMLLHLMKYTKEKPLPRKPEEGKTSPWYSPHTYIQYQSLYMPVFFVALLIVGGNMSFAAEQALPGDVLYPIKLRVNEKVQDMLKFTPKAKARWEEVKVERRLKEAEILIARGTFDESKRIQIEKEVEKNVENLSKENKQESERVRNTYIRFKNRNTRESSLTIQKHIDDTMVPQIIISTSTRANIIHNTRIQNTKIKMRENHTIKATTSISTLLATTTATTSENITVEVKIKNQDMILHNIEPNHMIDLKKDSKGGLHIFTK